MNEAQQLFDYWVGLYFWKMGMPESVEEVVEWIPNAEVSKYLHEYINEIKSIRL